MSIFVYLSALLAVANCCGMLYSGFGIWHILLFAATVLMALFGLLMPGPEKTDGRILCVLAVLLGVLPLLREPVRALRYTLKERAYAKKIAPLATQWKETREAFSDNVKQWEERYKAPPVFDGLTAMAPKPTGTESGGPTAAGPAPSALSLPTDPFNTDGESVRYWTNARDFWLITSKGPDKTYDLKLPPPLRPTDEADPRGRWIAINEENFINLRYDPTNGSLGKGDLLWVNGSAQDTSAFFESVSRAWAQALASIQSTRAAASEAQQAATAARTLLTQGDALAALAAATYSGLQIPQYPGQQKAGDFEGRLIQGEALYALGDPRMAAAALAAFVELDPNDPRGHFHLAVALYFSGDTEQARREFAAAWQLNDQGPLALPAYDAMVAIGKGKPPAVPPPGTLLKTTAAEKKSPEDATTTVKK